MTARQDRSHPVKSYTDPRIEIYAPTDTSPYYRVYGYDGAGRRVVDTTGGRTLRAAQDKASRIAKNLRRNRRQQSADPGRVLAHAEAAAWLEPANHRTRENKPWSTRHAENMDREWRLRISPHIPKRATVAELDDKQLWIRILNQAQDSGLSSSALQKTGQTCRSYISWLMDRGLLDRNPMRGVRYSVTKADNQGLDPKAVPPDQVPNWDMVYDLATWLAWLAWPNRPTAGGNRRHDIVGPQGRGLQPMLVATTGLRNGELFALRTSRIDITGLEIRIDEQLVEEDSGNRYITPPKHGSIRTVTFAGLLEHDLKELVDYRRWVSDEPAPILFPAPQGAWEYRRNFNRRFRAAASRANWPRHITWYSLRHLYGATMLRTLPLEIVSKLMGHHSPDFTAKRYLSPQVDWFDGARAASRELDPFNL